MRKLSLVICLLFLASATIAQRRDVGVWTSVSVEKAWLDGDLKLSGSMNMRMNENVTSVRSYFPEIGLQVKFWKLFRFGTEYRFNMGKADFGGYTPKHRIATFLTLKKNLNPLDASIRLQYQYGTDARIRKPFFQPISDHTFRIKVKIGYDNWKKIKPYISNEVFYDLGNHDLGRRFNKYRLNVGIDFKLAKRHYLKLAYIYNLEINVTNPWREHVASVGYTYEFKKSKRKKKSEGPKK